MARGKYLFSNILCAFPNLLSTAEASGKKYGKICHHEVPLEARKIHSRTFPGKHLYGYLKQPNELAWVVQKGASLQMPLGTILQVAKQLISVLVQPLAFPAVTGCVAVCIQQHQRTIHDSIIALYSSIRVLKGLKQMKDCFEYFDSNVSKLL